MDQTTAEKLAASLTAQSVELLPFLPYLLQDLWALGSSPDDMIHLIKTHIPISETSRILDLACGKGAVAIKIAQRLKISVDGVDLIPDFIAYAKNKAKSLHVDALCNFSTGDINKTVLEAKNYDCVILGAAGNVLGNPRDTLRKLRRTIKPGGYMLIDDAYLTDEHRQEEIKYQNYAYMTYEQWSALFAQCGLKLVDTVPGNDNANNDADIRLIAKRARELTALHPEKRPLFEGFIKSQQDECDDLENRVLGVTWMLQADCP